MPFNSTVGGSYGRNRAVTFQPVGSSIPGNTGFVPNSVTDPLDPGTTSTPGSPYGNGGGSYFNGGAAEFLQSLYSARPGFIKQQGSLLDSLGPALRQSIFNASPELAQASQYLTTKFADPLGGMRSTFEDSIRSAQAARGFTGGGSGVVGEEARYLNNYAEQQRMQLLPQLQAFGNNILGISGLQAPPDITLGAIGSLAFQNNQLAAQTAAGQQQSAWAQQMFKQLYGGNGGGAGGAAPSPFSGGASGGGAGGASGRSPFGGGPGGGGSYSFSAGSHGAGTYDPSGNLISSGNGNQFGGGVNPNGTPADADLATQAKILQASGKINTEQQYLDFIGQGKNDNARNVTNSFNGPQVWAL